MTTLSSTRTALISRLRKAQDIYDREELSRTNKQLEIRIRVENPKHAAKLDEYLAWQTRRLAKLSSAVHGWTCKSCGDALRLAATPQ